MGGWINGKAVDEWMEWMDDRIEEMMDGLVRWLHGYMHPCMHA